MAGKKASDEPEIKRILHEASKALAALDGFEALVESHLQASGQRRDHFGVMATSRPDLIYLMRRGTDFRRSTMRRVLAYIKSSELLLHKVHSQAHKRKGPVRPAAAMEGPPVIEWDEV